MRPLLKVSRWGDPWQAILLLLVLLTEIPATPALAANATKDEYEIKAALIYNFARFTEWPEDAFTQNPNILKLVVFGDERMSWAFNGINGKTVGSRTIKVEFTQNPLDVIGSQILFLTKDEREKWPQILAAIDGAAVLTIGEMNGFLEASGILNLALADNKITFQVNQNNSRANNIIISSRILKLASKVVEKKRGSH